MRTNRQVLSLLVVALCCATYWAACCTACSAAERQRIDDQWRFHRGDPSDAERVDFDDSQWASVRLPHDWSISLPRSPEATSAGGGGFFPTGVGWYRRALGPAHHSGDRYWVVFDGVYRNAQVWLNGQRLGAHAYGYTPFEFEITNQLTSEGPNTLAVRVDNSSQPNSRWYSGSGIYRHVWLERRPRRSITPAGCVVRVDKLGTTSADLVAQAKVVNDAPDAFAGRLRWEVITPAGAVAAAADADVAIDAGESRRVEQTLTLLDAVRWSSEQPAMYTARWELLSGDGTIDKHSVAFGVRTVSVDAQRGLILNGKPVKLFGGNVHHDNGCLGAAAFDEAEQRKARLLVDAGFNAVRTSHNPPSPAFLDACDELGLLVVDEAFDCWAKAKVKHDFHERFDAEWRDELAAMIRRDRNHPSVIMWSIGNEMYERGADHAPALAREMINVVRELDATRPVTAGVNGLGPNDWNRLDPLFAELDAAGYNYEQPRYDDDHRRVPSRVVYTSESYPKDLAFSRDAAMERPYAIGDFVWSGIDYLGEAGIGQVFPPGAEVTPHWKGSHYPYHGALCGDIDITGFRKPISHFRNIVWGRGEELTMAVIEPAPNGGRWQLDKWATEPLAYSWTWPGHEGEVLEVQVCCRWPTVQLELNGVILAELETGADHGCVASFEAPYAPGELAAVALDADGRKRVRMELHTAGPASQIKLGTDAGWLDHGDQNLCFVNVTVLDAQGRSRPDAGHEVTYSLTGPAEIIGVGSGDLASEEPYNASPRRVYHGRALVVVRAGETPGEITLTAQSAGLAPASITLNRQ